MTIKEAISAADALKPNQYDAAQKRAWLSELDGRIHRELILTHAHDAAQEEFSGYGEDADEDTALLVPYPFAADVYGWYLQSMIDLANGESGKYNQSAAQYNSAYSGYSNWYHRVAAPLPEASRFLF